MATESKRVWYVGSPTGCNLRVIADSLEDALATAQRVWLDNALEEGETLFGMPVNEVRSDGWVWVDTHVCDNNPTRTS